MSYHTSWSKSGALILVLAAGALCAAESRFSQAEQEKRMLVNRVDHGKQAIERKADELVRSANVKLAEGEYMNACNLYLNAKVEFKKFNSPFFDKKIAFCDQQIARCYYLQAEDAIRNADERSRVGDFETAIKLCKEALKYCPEQAEKLENLIAQYEKRKNYTIQQDNLSPDHLISNKKNQEYQIEVLLEQGRRLVAANELGAAVKKYQEIMLLDPYNEAAVKSLEGVYTRIGKIGRQRYNATHRRVISETEWKFASPVFPEADVANNTANFIEQGGKTKKVSAATTLAKKLNDIIIKEFSFDDIPVSVVVGHLRELTKQHDPAGLGVNFVYLAKNTTPEAAPAAAQAQAAEDGEEAPAQPPAQQAAPPAAPQGSAEAGEGENGPAEKTVTFSLKDKSVMEVLRSFKEKYGVKYKITDHYVILAPEHVNLGDLESRIFNVEIKHFDSNEELKNRLIAAGIPYGPGTSLFYDKKINCVFATNTPDNLNETQKFLEEEYNQSEPMIQLMLKIIEISQTDINELAFNWQYAVNSRVSTSNAAGDLKKTAVIQSSANELLRYYRPADAKSDPNTLADSALSYVWENSDGTKISASMFALNWADSGDVLYSPRVTVIAGQAAEVTMATVRYFPEDWETIDIEFSNEVPGWRMLSATPQPNLDNEQSLGVKVKLQPKIIDNRVIQVKVDFPIKTFVKWMEFDPNDPDADYIKMPIFNLRSINTLVNVHDGDTVLVGGVSTDLTKTYHDKIPILGDLPFVGRFFQSRYSEAEKGNMLIFLTCRIINPDGSAKYPEGRRPNGLANFGQNF